MASRPVITQPEPWVAQEKIDQYVQTEPALVLISLSLVAGMVYKLLLRGLSEERHRSLRDNFKNLAIHLVTGAVLFLSYRALSLAETDETAVHRLTSYVGLACLIQGGIVFVKIARLFVFEYMYISHMKVAFPLLVVNLFSLLLSIGMAYWLAAGVFGVKLAPLLATSAIFSIVLGLALQDTLGNLFSGIALQFDKPYEIGDWIEVQNGPQRWVGQVHEVHWRATVLTGLSDEVVTIPNRIMAQSQIANYNPKRHPILRSQIFKVPYGTPDDRVRAALLAVPPRIQAVRLNPKPLVLASESGESGVSYKLVYAVEDYGAQWMIADQVISLALQELQTIGVEIARPRLSVRKEG